MLKNFRVLVLFFLILMSFSSNAQISEGERPYTFINASSRAQSDSVFGEYQVINLVKPDLTSVLAEDLINDQEGLSYRVGIITPVSLSILNSGTWTVLSDGSKIWRLGIKMREAQALSLYFNSDVNIIGGGKLNAYNETQSQFIGSFTSNTPGFQAIEMIQGELITLEYFMPSGETQLPTIDISGVSYYYRGVENRIAGFRESTLNQNRGPHLSCHVDVACPEINGWTNQRDAVVHYTFRTGLFSTSMCSAGIINNTANDCTPYVLSANHCGEPTTNSDINGHVWYFNYQRPTCSPGNTAQYNGARSETMSGGTLKASSQLGNAPTSSTNSIKGSDFYLAELNTSIPASYGAFYAGWNKTSNAPSSGKGIHHPKGDEKKVATYTSTPSKVSYGGAWAYSHLNVSWSTTANGSGALEGGSSGSPLFNQSGLIVGPATASSLTCGSAGGYSLYGRLFKAWNQEGSNANQMLQPWLDPINSGASTLSGTYAPCSTGGGGSSSNGTCSNPLSISCGTPFNGTTVDGQNNIGSYSCAPNITEGGKEKLHSITITQQSDLTATLSNLNGVDLDVHILSGCVSGGCLARDDISATATSLAPGTYLISVDGYGFSNSQVEGTYTLTVTCTPSGGGSTPNGTCTSPLTITCGTPFNGTTVDGQNNITTYTQCGSQPENGKEKIHSITITQQSDLTATLSNLNGVDLDVHILSSCSANGCVARDDISATATSLAAGTYYISVDGYGTTGSQEGSYTLTVNCTPTGGGGTQTGDCNSPLSINCGTPFNGTTVDGQNNISAYTSCASQPENGKEKIHSITITQQSDLTATLSNLNGVDLDVHILSSCNTGGCLARDDISATATGLAAGTYLIAVDGYGTTGSQEGSYTLTVNCTPTGGGGGTQTGDCSSPLSISCGTPFNGTTVDGQNNISAYTSCASQPENGKEKIHSITITQQSDLTATLSNLNGVDLDVHILSSCNTGGCLARDDISATATGLAAGTYLIAVDGYGTTGSQEGSYTLTVNCTPTGGGGGTQTGDCSSPLSISCGTPFNGTTVDGQNNISAYTSCASQPENGKEKIHSITITQQSDLTATLSNLNGVDLDVHILSSCNTGGCLARDDISATATSLPAGTYLIAVDGYGTTGSQEGSYTLTVNCTPTGGGGTQTGDCTSPLSISCGTPFNGTTVDGQNNISAYTSCASQPENGKEKVHSITITQQSDLTATLSNLNGVDLDVHILSSCNTGGCLARDDISATATSLAAGTYLIAVDGYGTTGSQEGSYTLTVNCTPTGGSCTPESNSISQTICQGDSYQFGNQQLNTSGVYSNTYTNSLGCDSVVNLTLNVLPTSTNTASQTICQGEVYIFGSQALSQQGAYTEVFTNSNGCDSTVILNLQVVQPVNNNVSESTCSNPYLFGSQSLTQSGTYIETFQTQTGCDSTVTLTLTVLSSTSSSLNETICSGDSVQLGSNYYMSNGTYNETFIGSNGCDSIVTLTLSVQASALVNISLINGDLSSSLGSAYQWFLDGNAIIGANQQNYTPSTNGVYTVETTGFNGCIGSQVYNLQNVSIDEKTRKVLIYPNPNSGIFNISSSKPIEFTLLNVLGEVVFQSTKKSENHYLSLSLAKGVYYINIQGESKNVEIIIE